MCRTKPRNRRDLVERIKGTWADILDPNYLVKTCEGAWDRLRRVVAAKGSYLKSKESLEDNSDED